MRVLGGPGCIGFKGMCLEERAVLEGGFSGLGLGLRVESRGLWESREGREGG